MLLDDKDQELSDILHDHVEFKDAAQSNAMFGALKDHINKHYIVRESEEAKEVQQPAVDKQPDEAEESADDPDKYESSEEYVEAERKKHQDRIKAAHEGKPL